MSRNIATPIVIAVTIFLWLMVGSLSSATAQDSAPSDVDDPVDRATEALHNAEFESLAPILEPIVDAEDTDRPAEMHLLYALGLFYEAQTNDRVELEPIIDKHLTLALGFDSELDLDPMIYPPTFVARVEQMRAETEGVPTAEQAEIFYFERHVEHRSRLPLFLPGGVGQFYNGDTFRGITFATIQGLGLATNAAGFWMIESMRTDSGRVAAEDAARARGWRTAQLAGLAVFLSGWLLGSIESHLNFESTTVRIRTLDGPPEELDSFPGDELGHNLLLQLQWQTTF